MATMKILAELRSSLLNIRLLVFFALNEPNADEKSRPNGIPVKESRLVGLLFDQPPTCSACCSMGLPISPSVRRPDSKTQGVGSQAGIVVSNRKEFWASCSVDIRHPMHRTDPFSCESSPIHPSDRQSQPGRQRHPHEIRDLGQTHPAIVLPDNDHHPDDRGPHDDDVHRSQGETSHPKLDRREYQVRHKVDGERQGDLPPNLHRNICTNTKPNVRMMIG